jgi:hypothetical protein
VGSIGTALALGGVALIMANHGARGLLLPLLVLFIASFAISQGAVIWVYLSEIFPTGVRARGQSLGSATHWILNALISGTFPIVAAYSRPAPFVVFAAMMALQFVAALLFMPETRGVMLEHMNEQLRGPLHGATQRNMRTVV